MQMKGILAAKALFGAQVMVFGGVRVTGDGHHDVIVGAPFYEVTEPAEGMAFLFLGSPSGLPSRS